MSTFRNAKKIVVPEPGNEFGSDDVLLLGGSMDLLTDGFLLIYSEVCYFS